MPNYGESFTNTKFFVHDFWIFHYHDFFLCHSNDPKNKWWTKNVNEKRSKKIVQLDKGNCAQTLLTKIAQIQYLLCFVPNMRHSFCKSTNKSFTAIVHHISFIFASIQTTNRGKCIRNAAELNYVQSRGSILFSLFNSNTLSPCESFKNRFYQNRPIIRQSLELFVVFYIELNNRF